MKKPVIIIAGLLVFLGAGLYFWNASRPIGFIGSIPTNKSSNVERTAKLSFTFDANLSGQHTLRGEDPGQAINDVILKPSVDGVTTVSDNEITFTPTKGYRPSTHYTATVSGVRGSLGRKGEDVTITFDTAYVSPDKLPLDDPGSSRSLFIKSLPYTTDAYNIDYIQSGDYFLVQITAAPVAANKQAALAFMQSKGIKTATDQIQYLTLRGL